MNRIFWCFSGASWLGLPHYHRSSSTPTAGRALVSTGCRSMFRGCGWSLHRPSHCGPVERSRFIKWANIDVYTSMYHEKQSGTVCNRMGMLSAISVLMKEINNQHKLSPSHGKLSPTRDTVMVGKNSYDAQGFKLGRRWPCERTPSSKNRWNRWRVVTQLAVAVADRSFLSTIINPELLILCDLFLQGIWLRQRFGDPNICEWCKLPRNPN